MRATIYAAATKLLAVKGYEATTLRDIAASAGVSPGLLYKYFESKRSVVLALYDELSAAYAARGLTMQRGPWRDRFFFAVRASLEVLEPQRATLTGLLPVLLGGAGDALFSPSTRFSRERVEGVFRTAVSEATDAASLKSDAEALGRILYALHLAIILFWLLDKSHHQRATATLISSLERASPMLSLAFRFQPARNWLRLFDTLFREGLLGEGLDEVLAQ